MLGLGSQVPYDEARSGSDAPPAVGTERSVKDAPLLRNCPEFRPCPHVPEDRVAVIASREDRLPVGAEEGCGQLPAVPHCLTDLTPRRDVPDAGSPIFTRRENA